MTLWSDNANTFATHQDEAARAHQHAGVRDAIAHLVDHGDPDAAYARLIASVEHQARILGLGRLTLTEGTAR